MFHGATHLIPLSLCTLKRELDVNGAGNATAASVARRVKIIWLALTIPLRCDSLSP